MKLILIGLFLFPFAHAHDNDQSALNLAQNSLLQNIVSLRDGEFLTAGGHQFGSLWTRDFCFSVPGLLKLKKDALVKNQLNYLISHRRADGLVPIYADSIHPMIRVVGASVNHALKTKIHFKIKDSIRSYYTANGKYPTIDANLLVLIAAFNYYQATGDEVWWKSHQQDFLEIYQYYNQFLNDGLIVQGEFSDWQDSARRAGKTFFTNILFLDVSSRFHFLSSQKIDELRRKIHETFYDEVSGLYFSVEGHRFVSLEGILWSLEHKLMPAPDYLYERLKQHPLWSLYGVPGFATYPSYPKDWLATHIKISGLKEYHGNLSWSWLMAYSARVARIYNDEGESQRISQFLQDLILRDQVVHEIYFSFEGHPFFQSRLYQSEAPFSWGSAFVVELLSN